jgi:hypothetical protein
MSMLTTHSNLYPVSWASFKVKLVHEAGTYVWQQPTFFVERDPGTGRQIVWLIDFLPCDQQSVFLKNLPKRSDRDRNLFLWHTAFTKEILGKFDTSFWLLRDLVCNFEKVHSSAQVTLVATNH